MQILARISAYTSAINPANNDGRKTSPQIPFPSRKNIQLKKPPAAARGRYLFFILKENSKSHRTNGSGDQLYHCCYHQSPSLPNRMIAPINPSANAAARSNAVIRRIIPESVSPIRTSRIAFVDISPGIRSMMSPIIILSIWRDGQSNVNPQIAQPVKNDAAN